MDLGPESVEYLSCSRYDLNIVMNQYKNLNYLTLCMSDTGLPEQEFVDGFLTLSRKFISAFKSSKYCELCYPDIQDGLNLIEPPCLMNSISTKDLANKTFNGFIECLSEPIPSVKVNWDVRTVIEMIVGSCLFAIILVLIIARKLGTKKSIIIGDKIPLYGAFDASFDFSAIQAYKISPGNSILIDKQLGNGAFAEVWLGKYNGIAVAMKKLLVSRLVSHNSIQAFIDEIALAATFDSPYIVKCIGATWTTPTDVTCIMEYMNLGDLRDYLASHDHSTYSWQEKLLCMRHIIHGLSYLHSMKVVHRDIKSRNILLDSTKGTKLTDFGISKEDKQATMTMGVGTYRWMAPEVLKEDRYTCAADVYSFGMVLSEFDSHQIPYYEKSLSDIALIGRIYDGTLHPKFSPLCPASVRDLAFQCLARNPNERPTVYKIAAMLKKMQL